MCYTKLIYQSKLRAIYSLCAGACAHHYRTLVFNFRPKCLLCVLWAVADDFRWIRLVHTHRYMYSSVNMCVCFGKFGPSRRKEQLENKLFCLSKMSYMYCEYSVYMRCCAVMTLSKIRSSFGFVLYFRSVCIACRHLTFPLKHNLM